MLLLACLGSNGISHPLASLHGELCIIICVILIERHIVEHRFLT